ncbi:MAG: SUMF1/EgtB/PvdO family nonheme iron enzyme [Myxococcota bacterium]
MVQIGSFCIDRFEAHLITVDVSRGTVRRHPAHLRPPRGQWFAAHAAPGVPPQAYISRVEAAEACDRAGKRLCRWLEWRRGCQGRSWRRYPYGHAGRRGVCNTARPHLLHALFADETPWSYEGHFNTPLMSLVADYLAPSGAFEGCVSADGVHDLNGNLHEWVATTVTEDFIERMEGEPVDRVDQPWTVGNGMFLGGFYSTTDQHGPGCFYTTVAHEPTYHDYSTGFRCCADAFETPDVAR